MLILGALGVLAGLAFLLREEPAGSPAATTASPGLDALGAPAPAEPLRTEVAGGGAPAIEVGAPRRIDRPLGSLDGRGRLRGSVEVARGEFPPTWRLILSPSETIRGQAAGEARVLDFTAAEREFELDDLPLAGYDLRVEAPGMNTRVQRVLLEKPVTDQFVVLQLVPTGFVDGRVLDEDGGPVAALPVVLEAVPAGTRQSIETDPGGAFHLAGVLDGDYRITAGDPDLPLSSKELRFVAPSLHVELRVPVLGHVTCRVVDAFGASVEGVEVLGFGPRGASVSGVSDRAGLVQLPHLPPGSYRLVADDEHHGRGRARLELAPGERGEARLALTR